MAHISVDELQKTLQKEVFEHLPDSKKAAGRALGTIVEIITYYLLKTWGLNDSIQIEKSLVEYGNSSISHNVEFSLHPIIEKRSLTMPKSSYFTSGRILRELDNLGYQKQGFTKLDRKLIDKGVLRNACIIAQNKDKSLLCSIDSIDNENYHLRVCELYNKPFALFECKRVGVEEGCKKGPQTIEKAKQGAYVARASSALQKVRTNRGTLNGIIYFSDGTYEIGYYYELLEKILKSSEPEHLRDFILSVGIVSNHGNWFTSENQNKEMKVLVQSYDWLLFLTDVGLTRFLEELITSPKEKYIPIKQAFLSSYVSGKRMNQFTKVRMNLEADVLLQEYFRENLNSIEGWFNVISHHDKTLGELKHELQMLKDKEWSKFR